jgi:hypothetical protein
MNSKLLFFPAILIAIVSSGCSSQSGGMTWENRWGDPGSTTGATRTITISPNTQYVNVTGGQIVKFVDGDKSFAWNFDGPGGYTFDLAQVAPRGTLDHSVQAYVDPDPFYSGGR